MPADLLFIGGDVLDALCDHCMVFVLSRQRRRVRLACRDFQNFELRLGDAYAVLVHPSQSVIALRRAQIDERTAGASILWRISLGRIDDRRKPRDRLQQRRVRVDRILPYLIRVGSEIDLRIRLTVQNAGVLVVEINKFLALALVFEECFVGSDDFGVFLEPLANARSQLDQALHSVSRQEGVAEDFLGGLADAIDTSRTLDESDNRPGQIVVHKDRAILKVLALAEHVGCDQDAQFVVRFDLIAFVVAARAEAPRKTGRVRRFA